MVQVDFLVQTPDDVPVRFSVVCARHKDRWLLVRHRERETFEIPGGHIELGETPLSAARRELYEETGAVDYDLSLVSPYTVTIDGVTTGGCLYFADIKALGALPAYEIAEVKLFDRLPDNLTYPDIQPPLFEQAQNWLNLQSAKDELWDVLDENRRPTGRLHRRGDPLLKGDYHLTVFVWIQNGAGQFLLTKRAPNKGYPHMWECTGGSAVTGDDSLTAAVREVEEETGLTVLPANGRCVKSIHRADSFCDVWLFRQDFNIEDVVLQENETCDARWASKDDLRHMIAAGECVPFGFDVEELFVLAEGNHG